MKLLRKKIVFIFIILMILIIGGVIYYFIRTGRIVSQASVSGVTLGLSPSSGNQIINTNFDVNILLNTNGQPTVGTDVVLTYNPPDLSVIDSDTGTAGTQIRAGSLYYSYPANTVDTTNGKITFSGIIQPGGATYSGAGTLATITFRALSVQSSSRVNFNFTIDATNDSNVTSPAGSDMLDSVTNGNYNLVPPDATFNFNETLQGRTNHSSNNAILKVYPTGSTTALFTSASLVASAAGAGQTTITGVNSGNYDFQLKVKYFLSTKLTNITLTNPMTRNFDVQRAGDLDDNNIVNSLDFTILNSKWNQADPVADINQDGVTNTVDFALLNSNWFVSGQ
ncbi:hypothetical protein A2V71_00960 [Candidatus Berkelbacteria bacterium RBG_13_40_8]|uniref:Cohesin domain-containing protein n=1 Tax=Candidatus Berkelbacteria bacterium RBG_13_40_8 TaxID=1797467 RepID=A0A1F5DNY4_9BACT|nr:MAG: hypothetical protein A2V71_00960 [Candidatus Berkelbacteria bacterium RBG_13_40_8]